MENHAAPTANWLDEPDKVPEVHLSAAAKLAEQRALGEDGVNNQGATISEHIEHQALHLHQDELSDQGSMHSNPAMDCAEQQELGEDAGSALANLSGDSASAFSEESHDGLDIDPYLSRLGFAINRKHRILCCLICQMAFDPDDAADHLRKKHKPMPPAYDSAKFQNTCKDRGIQRLPEFHSSDHPLPIAGLPVRDGFKCNVCNKASGSKEYMEKHVRRDHAGFQDPLATIVVACSIQQYNTRGTATRMAFCVYPPEGGRQSDLPGQGSFADFVKSISLPPPPSYLAHTQDSRYISPWLTFTRWHTFTEAHSISILRSFVAASTDADFCFLSQMVRSYYDAALNLIKSTSSLVLQRLKTDDPAKGGISNTPFREHQQAHTHTDYQNVLVRLVAMILRSCERSSEYPFPMPENIANGAASLLSALKTASESPIFSALHHLLITMWTTHWTPTEENPVPSPTEQFLVLRSLREDGAHAEAKHMTGIFAKLKYNMRLTFLYEIKHQSKTRDGGPDDSAECAKLQDWFTEKIVSDFNTVCSYQHVATSITKSAMGLPRILWTDRQHWMSMLYQGDRVEFRDLQSVFADIERRLQDLWENKLTLNTGIRIDTSNIKEDVANTIPGYCFLDDPRNVQLQHPMQLLHRFTSSDDIRRRFLTFCDGTAVWSESELRKWLQWYAEFSGLLLLNCEMLGGGAERGTEIASMKFRSTPFRRVRNLSVMDKHLALITTYHKTGALSAIDKYIPHSIGSFTSDLILQDLAIARPFARFASGVCFPGNHDVQELYYDHLFVNYQQPWDTGTISNLMRQVTRPHVGIGLSVNSWRHISIAFRRKLCSSAVLEISEESIEALSSGHTREQENRTYGISNDMLAGPSEDIVPLYLDASVDWQLKMRVVPGGLMIPYQDALSCKFDQLQAQGLFKDLGSRAARAAETAEPLSCATVTDIADAIGRQLAVQIESAVSAATKAAASEILAKLVAALPAMQPLYPQPSQPLQPPHSQPQSPEPQSPEPQSPEPQSPEPQSPEPQSPEPQSPEPQSPEPQSPEPQPRRLHSRPSRLQLPDSPWSPELQSPKLRPRRLRSSRQPEQQPVQLQSLQLQASSSTSATALSDKPSIKTKILVPLPPNSRALLSKRTFADTMQQNSMRPSMQATKRQRTKDCEPAS
ncbi:hypothetical protein CERSUDRAFT_100189 [Gelatoporia subvermispora B]|uniref:C2H2-type domain-containing protein n=1 Tax=Ceriporiopsis subvermispora (strain B) TaxID=914234 RepID=M2QI07_CERS8|nr:hypothetical protein CERSUDRAFT_100189 [Gelatoporia subvermispora B]